MDSDQIHVSKSTLKQSCAESLGAKVLTLMITTTSHDDGDMDDDHIDEEEEDNDNDGRDDDGRNYEMTMIGHSYQFFIRQRAFVG